ncbi:MAG TPA: endolytic transglycosylase MltG, partial [Afifellaceae bacterium]|nr:endolytic transglycosylase MltG [Afifellaceae bacterium]
FRLAEALPSVSAGELSDSEELLVEESDVEEPYVEWSDAEVSEVSPPTSTTSGRRRITLRSPRQAIEPELAPPPPARSRQVRHPLVVVLNFVMMAGVLAMLVIGAGLYFGAVRFNAEGPLTESKTVVISRGADLESIAGLLQRQNVIDSSFIFSNGVRLSKFADKLQAGEYLFEAGVSMRDVMNALVTGKAILHGFTVPEGLTSEQIVARLADDPVLTGELSAIPAEGSLLPETYKFSRGTTREQIIDQMRRAQERTVAEIWARRSSDLPITTPAEFVTLASIVEKETGKADERPLVAAVFINRLRRNMRLQSDPTFIYGIFGGKGKPPDRLIYRSDIDRPTPYNTYVIDGLPPGPIANPGRAALEAVANPSRTNHLYFVADGSGGHAFAETLEEHTRNVERWRRIEAERRKAEEAAHEADETDAQDGAGNELVNGSGSGESGDAGGDAKPKAKPQ